MKRFKYLLLFILSFNLITSCFSDDDIDDNPIATSEINEFIWTAMNQWYFWQGSVPDLADNRFSSNEEFSEYLESFTNPNELFNNLLFSEDRFSFIVDDFNALFNSLEGTTLTNGLEFGLGTINGSSDVFGIVRLVLPNSNASTQDIQRGDIFTEVNGIQLTESNFRELLFTGSDTYTLNILEISNNDLIDTSREVTLTKEVYTENPVFIANTIDTGTRKVGYLMYNRFTDEFDTELNNAFGQFLADGIEDLVLDLRYNPGGSVQSAIHLSSMITGQFTGQLLFRGVWNDKIQAQLSEEVLNRNFVDNLSSGAAINSLNLNRVFILAQQNTASASELVINSLTPYIDVIHIGGFTTGKNEFSTTLLDVPECNFIGGSGCGSFPNRNHTWAIQPLLGRNANADGFFEYTDGLIPNIFLDEDLANYGVLGDINEPLLARALQQVSISTSIESTEPQVTFNKIIASSNMETPLKDNMYISIE
ncbi:carboxyl-terminal protease [Flavobacteriaceae bacterium AU392]|nr:carboxyl-terminal protease [Flavobacteriaceae bacterium]RKM83523.1 carboxyl-terminal protease [Flavobacteriaceae bacterium AU392]